MRIINHLLSEFGEYTQMLFAKEKLELEEK